MTTYDVNFQASPDDLGQAVMASLTAQVDLFYVQSLTTLEPSLAQLKPGDALEIRRRILLTGYDTVIGKLPNENAFVSVLKSIRDKAAAALK